MCHGEMLLISQMTERRLWSSRSWAGRRAWCLGGGGRLLGMIRMARLSQRRLRTATMCSHVFTSSAGSLGGRHTSLVKRSSCCPALPCAGWVGCPAPLLKGRWTGWLALTAFLHMCAVLGIRSGAANSRAPSPLPRALRNSQRRLIAGTRGLTVPLAQAPLFLLARTCPCVPRCLWPACSPV